MCAAAVCSGFMLCAAGQSIPDQTQVGLERAIKMPAEIIWLRDEILAELWRKSPRLEDSPARCDDTGNVKRGCTVGDPPSWRYVFGAGAHDSRFKPLTSGMYLISRQSKKTGLVRAPTGQILLAAGTSVTLIDAAYPGIQIELTAPPDQPLPLGNLAAAVAGKMFGLLARQPGAVSASAASVLESGRVALKSAGEVRMAAAIRIETASPKEVPKPVEVAMAAPLPRVLAHAAAAVPRAQGYREPDPVDVSRARALVFAGTVDLRAASKWDEKLKLVPGPVIGAAAPVPVVAETPVLPDRIAAASEPVTVTPSASMLETPRVQQEVQRVASANPDIVRLRAEIEAEIARDRERIAAAMLPCGKPGASTKQGCTIGPAPRKFVFAGA
jgi:hypothetical protein